MTTLLCITQKLFKLNLFVAVITVVGVVALREQQAMVTDNQQKHLDKPLGYHQALKQVSYDYSPSSAADAEKMRRYEQKVQELTQQIKDFQGKATPQKTVQSPKPRIIPKQVLVKNPYAITTLARPEPYRVVLKESYRYNPYEKPRQPLLVIPPQDKVAETPREQTQTLIPPINLKSANTSNLVQFLGNSLDNLQIFPWIDSQAPQEQENIIVAHLPIGEATHEVQSLRQEEIRENPAPSLPPALPHTKPQGKDVIMGYVERMNKGLSVAQEKGEIKYGTRNYNKVQTAIKYLRTTANTPKVSRESGESPEELINQTLKEAAHVSQLPSVEVLKKLSDYAEKYEDTRQKQQKKLLSPEILELTNQEIIISYANSIAVGLIEADKRGEITSGTRNYKKVQTAIKYMRLPDTLEKVHQAVVESPEVLIKQTLEEAAHVAQLSSPDVLRQLGRYGQQRPGIRLEVTQIIDNVNE